MGGAALSFPDKRVPLKRLRSHIAWQTAKPGSPFASRFMRATIGALTDRWALVEVDVVVAGGDILCSLMATEALTAQGYSVLFAPDDHEPDSDERALMLSRRRIAFTPRELSKVLSRRLPDELPMGGETRFIERLARLVGGRVTRDGAPSVYQLKGGLVIDWGSTQANDQPYFVWSPRHVNQCPGAQTLRGKIPTLSFATIQGPRDNGAYGMAADNCYIKAGKIVLTTEPTWVDEIPKDRLIRVGAALRPLYKGEGFEPAGRIADVLSAWDVVAQLKDGSSAAAAHKEAIASAVFNVEERYAR